MITKGHNMTPRYRFIFDGFVYSDPGLPHVRGQNFASVIYHNRSNGPTPSSCFMMVLPLNSWDADCN